MHFKKIDLDESINKQRGTIAVLSAIFLTIMIGIMAYGIDVGYVYVVRNELQNAADAAALAGAGSLYPLIGTPPAPNWTAAQTKANTAIGLNKATNTTLVTGTGVQVQTGYWNIYGKTSGVYKGVHSPMDAPIINQVRDLPAVQVTINKASGNANLPVPTFFAKMFGIQSVDMGATAVAVVASPGTTTSPLMPFAIPQCIFDNTALWSSTGVPVPNNPITLGSVYSQSTCGNTQTPVQWTSFMSGSQADSYLKTLIQQATGAAPPPNPPTTLSVGQQTWIQSGAEANLYSTGGNQPSIDGCSAAGNKSCEYALVSVVDSLTPGGNATIDGFACVHILSAAGGSSKTITIELVAVGTVPECQLSGSGGSGNNYGAYEPPSLVNYSGNNY